MIYSLSELTKNDIAKAGYKGAWLGEILQHSKFNIPSGFIISPNIFDNFLQANNLKLDIESRLKEINIEKIDTLEAKSSEIRDMIHDQPFTPELEELILNNFRKLKNKTVSVRSAACAPYVQVASWSAYLETLLNVDEKHLLKAVKKVWQSFYDTRPLHYRLLNQQEDYYVKQAILIQTMIPAELSGMAYNKHPVTKDNDHLLIEAIHGIGQGIKYEHIHPDSYLLDKQTLKVLDVHINPQEEYIATKKVGIIFKRIKTVKQFRNKLTTNQIQSISKEVIKVSEILNFDCEIEWAIYKKKIYILQIKSIN